MRDRCCQSWGQFLECVSVSTSACLQQVRCMRACVDRCLLGDRCKLRMLWTSRSRQTAVCCFRTHDAFSLNYWCLELLCRPEPSSRTSNAHSALFSSLEPRDRARQTEPSTTVQRSLKSLLFVELGSSASVRIAYRSPQKIETPRVALNRMSVFPLLRYVNSSFIHPTHTS